MAQQIVGGSCIVEFDDDAETSEVLGSVMANFKNALIESAKAQYSTWTCVSISHNFIMINGKLHLTMMMAIQVD